jgi:polyribonucleotide nucleotidyltransferase
MQPIVHEFEIDGTKIRLETGEIAKQASGAVLLSCNGTTLLIAATGSKEPREGVDFFPLMVDFEERMYAAGKFPGGFFKREGRPSEDAILAGRRIDRTLRPIFPDTYRNEVQIVITTLSSDLSTRPDILGIIGASAALELSHVPFPKIIGAVRMGLVDGTFVANPNYEQSAVSEMNLLVSGTADRINMIEDESAEVSEELLLEGLKRGHEVVQQVIREISAFADKAGRKEKLPVPEAGGNEELKAKVRELLEPRLKKIIPADDKADLYADISLVKREVRDKLLEGHPEIDPLKLGGVIDKYVKEYAREFVLQKKTRVDGRGPEDIRPISSRVALLPRVHGSALFTRGQTQVLSSVTLGTFADRQRVDSLNVEMHKRYVHHYNFPPYSVGEVRFMRGPGRREIGHGALAEKALLPVIPDEIEFPYAIRVVSEVTESNASSSMASACGSTLALMDAGVPLKRPVAGVSTGLVMRDENDYMLLSDMSGFEDFNGDMDFKVAGTERGITAIQVDVKIEGLTLPIIEQILERSRVGRMYILEEMRQVIAEPRGELSEFAPKLMILKIDPEQIGLVIGPAGKTIKGIQADTGASIDIDEDGTVYVAGVDADGVRRAYETIKSMTLEIEAGMEFQARVVSIVPFGAFLEIVPGRDGLLHISNVAAGRIERVEDVLSLGDIVPVRVREVDTNGKVNLVRTDIEYSQRGSGGGGDRGGRRDGGGRPSGPGGRGDRDRDRKPFRR